MSALEPKKTIVINPDFLKLPMKGGKTRKNKNDPNAVAKPIKIRADAKSESEKTIKRRALNYIRKQQEDKYRRLMKGVDDSSISPVPENKTYADEFKSDFDDSLAFLQKLTDQSAQTAQVRNATLRHNPPISANSLLLQPTILDKVLHNGVNETISLVEPSVFREDVNQSRQSSPSLYLPKPAYGCLKGGNLPTYRTLKTQHAQFGSNTINTVQTPTTTTVGGRTDNLAHSKSMRLTPEQQRAELKQFLEKRREEKQRIKRPQNIIRPGKKQKRTTTRTFRVGKSKHYPRVGVLIPNKTIRTQILAKKQKIRETSLEDVRRHLIKTGLIRVGSSCPNDVLRQMYESSMMMCGEIQNHNPDNLLYNYLHSKDF